MSNAVRKLFISFWDVCLGNLPEGAFTHRRVPPKRAARMIANARERKALVGLCKEDLLAPYHRRERKNHDSLRDALNSKHGIAVSFRDFVSAESENGRAMYHINPLNCVRIEGNDRLLIVNCNCALGDKKPGSPISFKIELTSIEFNVIERAKGTV